MSAAHPSNVEVIENQRWYPLAGWSHELSEGDPPPWSDSSRKYPLFKKNYPNNIWKVFTSEDYDEEGWIYSTSFTEPFGPKNVSSVVRSRVWLIDDEAKKDESVNHSKIGLFHSVARFAAFASKSAMHYATNNTRTVVSFAANSGTKALQEVSSYAIDSAHAAAMAAITTEPYIAIRRTYEGNHSEVLKFRNLTAIERQLVSCCSFRDDNLELPKPPDPKIQETCMKCEKVFGVTLFRYNCGFCGNSFCREHLRERRVLRKYGHTLESKLCDLCNQVLSLKEDSERKEWRIERVQDFLNDRLISYINTAIDTKLHKVLRATQGTIAAAKAAPLGAGAKLAINSIDIARRYGRAGLASIFLRNEFMESFTTLKALIGEINTITFQDAAIGIYYLMAMNRGTRGLNPLLEQEQHKGCSVVDDNLINQLLRFASLSAHIIYQETVLDIQRLAKLQGYSLVYAVTDSPDISQPFFGILAHREKKIAALVIRGSKSVQDLLTDLRAMPNSVKESKEADSIPSSLEAAANMDDANSYDTFAHAGILKAAQWIKSLAFESLQLLQDEGYQIVLSGHSLGAGCAALLSVLLKPDFPNLVCYAYAIPACADALIADSCRSYVYSVVLRDDFVPRLKPPNIVKLAEYLALYKDEWRDIASEDWEAYKTRAMQIWVPRHREWAKEDSKEGTSGHQIVFLDPPSAVKHLQETISNPIVEEEWKIHSGNIVEKYHHVTSLSQVEEKKRESQLDQELFIPGSIIHLYYVKGIYEAVIIDREDNCLSRIDVFSSMLADHLGKNYIEALTTARDAKSAKQKTPNWIPFGSKSECMCCNSPFTWNSTTSSVAQQNKDQHHCRKCGSLVCDGCSTKRMCIPELGINFPVRLCDRCWVNH